MEGEQERRLHWLEIRLKEESVSVALQACAVYTGTIHQWGGWLISCSWAGVHAKIKKNKKVQLQVKKCNHSGGGAKEQLVSACTRETGRSQASNHLTILREWKSKVMNSSVHQRSKERWSEMQRFCINRINPPPFTEILTPADGFICTNRSRDKTCQLNRACCCPEIHLVLSSLSMFQCKPSRWWIPEPTARGQMDFCRQGW